MRKRLPSAFSFGHTMALSFVIRPQLRGCQRVPCTPTVQVGSALAGPTSALFPPASWHARLLESKAMFTTHHYPSPDNEALDKKCENASGTLFSKRFHEDYGFFEPSSRLSQWDFANNAICIHLSCTQAEKATTNHQIVPNPWNVQLTSSLVPSRSLNPSSPPSASAKGAPGGAGRARPRGHERSIKRST